ncbi:hypothetical protein T4A_2964 [Trichinella pseudospiralis]|uniref:Uncharacterized protein n=1 Tax=Trichinella pseudospiralis TaxID=6337 RepID=A0A0V1ELW8_TRIPS|nr:hypothetical protein T4A_2964 [Trichinella pseudospiralis]
MEKKSNGVFKIILKNPLVTLAKTKKSVLATQNLKKLSDLIRIEQNCLEKIRLEK